MEHVQQRDDAELRIAGIEALSKALGPTDMLRFLSLLHREPTDYVKISRRLYEGQDADEVFERAAQHWSGEAGDGSDGPADDA